MPQRCSRGTVAVAAAALLSAGTVAAMPVAAGASSATARQVAGLAPTSVTMLLRAPHPAALDRLASAHHLTHAQRVARLAQLVPSASAVDTVSGSLRAEGLRIANETAWSITATGTRSLIASVFGTRPGAVPRPSIARLQAETGPLPDLPAVLAPYVVEVLPTIGGPAVLHHSAVATLAGGGFRDAYTSKGTRPPGSSRTADGKSTVATLQLADYKASDLTKYARKEKLPKIVGTSKYHKVVVDGGPSASDDSDGGDVEVDLDQESILSTAPSASQRPYFAPNSNAGVIGVFANVFDDVVQNRHENGHGDPHIVALSSSWGGCEADTGAAQIAAEQTVIKALVAAGVTVFSSSGDDGIYDCGSSVGVDYPASSPQVVAVGGTNLRPSGKKPARNNGHNWHEKAWSCSSSSECVGPLANLLPVLPRGTGGTGGGESGVPAGLLSASPFAGFAEPAYQKRSIHGPVFGHQHHRMVPDIAADGDPSTGFRLYSSDPEVASDKNSRGLVAVGGTSLSSPMSAALFTNMLAGAGVHAGIGDIHSALYTAYRKGKRVFRDVTVGVNGASGDRGRDPSVTAHRGYDTVSGLGGVLWPALVPYLHLRRKHHR